MVSGVDGSIAKENACAIEHILDERILTGIRMFMENRHTYSYMTRGNDLNLMFPEGKRIMPIAFFEKGTSHPRILSKEYQQFEKRAEVAISKEIVVCDHHEEEIKEESVRILTVSLI